MDAKAIDRFREAVTLGGAMPKTFVDERPVQDVERDYMPLRGEGFVTGARLRLKDGQLLVIDKLSKPRTTSDSSPPTASKVVQGSLKLTETGRAIARTAIPVRITLRVTNLDISLRFYTDVLGLTALRDKSGAVSLSDWLSLRELVDDRNGVDTNQGAGDLLLTLQVDDFEAAVARARNSDLGKIIRVDTGEVLPHMRLRDPDGHNLLIEPQRSES